ncbi:dimethyladenosine transferase-like protein [Xylogone sp. PMI_703]|nr:dimethyladenosine transferase-like protein [Xylogone sp. PMI_703]
MAKSAKTTQNKTARAGLPYSRPSGNDVFKFNTNLGQHILQNIGVADAIVEKANLRPTDTVLEISPGTGNLTARILLKAKKVIAVELDPRMAAEVTKRFQGQPEQNQLEVLLGDVIKTELPSFDVYFLAPNIQTSLYAPPPPPPRAAILMFQREFALRLIAQPGHNLYCRLTVNVQLFAKVAHILKVGKNNFRPPPQVESSVVRIEPKLGADRPKISWPEWDGMLRVCFTRRNKTLRASWLGSKKVLAMCERNFKVWSAFSNTERLANDSLNLGDTSSSIQGFPSEEEWENDLDMDEDDVVEIEKANKTSETAQLVRGKIKMILEATELADKRASHCDQNDFLRLLHAFNQEGIHFA